MYQIKVKSLYSYSWSMQSFIDSLHFIHMDLCNPRQAIHITSSFTDLQSTNVTLTLVFVVGQWRCWRSWAGRITPGTLPPFKPDQSVTAPTASMVALYNYNKLTISFIFCLKEVQHLFPLFCLQCSTSANIRHFEYYTIFS